MNSNQIKTLIAGIIFFLTAGFTLHMIMDDVHKRNEAALRCAQIGKVAIQTADGYACFEATR